MNITDDSYATLSRAYSKSNLDLWDQNFVNGEYIVAFELNPHLNHNSTVAPLPKCYYTFGNFGEKKNVIIK